jgi:hypothetical protein
MMILIGNADAVRAPVRNQAHRPMRFSTRETAPISVHSRSCRITIANSTSADIDLEKPGKLLSGVHERARRWKAWLAVKRPKT